MKTIVKRGEWCGRANVRYVVELAIVDVRDVVSMANPALLYRSDPQLMLIDDLVLSSSATIHQLLFRFGECTFNETEVYSSDGINFQSALSTQSPGQDLDLLDFLNTNREGRWIAVFRDSVGYYYIVGSKEIPLSNSYNRSFAGPSAVGIAFATSQLQPAFRLDISSLDELIA